MMKLTSILFFIIVFVPFAESQVILLSESFETDGEGTRYTSNTFNFCAGSPGGNPDYFLRTNTNPALPPGTCAIGFGSSITNVQGSFYWASEDIRSNSPIPNANPPGDITFFPLNITGYNNLMVSLYLATANNNNLRWEDSDSINLKVSINNGAYVTVGRFMGNAPAGGRLIIDSNLNGVYDSATEVTPSCDIDNMTKYTFSIPATGSTMNLKIDFDQIGGTEELAIDLIEVTGTAAPGACPNTNPSFFCTPYNASGLSLNNRTFLCDMLAGEYMDVVLTAGNTYRVDFCGFAGGTPAPPYNSLITVYNQTNNTLIGFNDDFCGDDPQLDFIAPVTGTYRVLANISGNCSGTNGFIFTPLGLTLLSVASSPMIVVSGNGQPILDGDTSPSNADNTSFGSIPACNGTIVKSFSIQNTGTSNLTISGVNFTGGNTSDFSLTSAPAGTVTPGNSTSFQVTFNPSATGLRSTTLEIANNVAGANPFNFSIEGSGSASPISAMITGQTNVLCFGQSTASLTTTVSNGTANYNYTWSNGSNTNNTSLITNTISMLPAGSYMVTVTDVNGCTASTNAMVTQPSMTLSLSKVISHVTCIGGSNGAVDLMVSGGTSAYNYEWSNGAVSQDISGLTANTYFVTVTDANGCTASNNVSVTAPNFTILGNNNIINDGDNSPSNTDGTDFGTQAVNSSTPQLFTINNSSVAIPIDAVNSSAAQFTLSSVPTNLTSNGTEDFTVSYQPTTSGNHIGAIEVYYNGCISPYNFTVQGATCTGNNFTFIGPGSDAMLSSNWLNGCIPPMNNVNTVVTIQSGSTLILNGPFTGDIINYGTLKGSVLLTGNLINNGKVSPGN